MKKLFNFLVLILIVGGAIALVAYKIKNKPPIEHKELGFPIKAVKVLTAEKIPFRARALAFGNVEPATVLKAKSEVSGKISYIHPSLKKGASLKKGTVVLRIEPTTYKLSLNQSKAGLAGSQSSLKQLEAEEKSTKRALSLAKKNLNVELKELNRLKTLWNKRLIARSALDKEEQIVLSLRQQVQDIQGKLATFSSRRDATLAQIRQSKSQVDQSKDRLGRTEIRLPFDARIGTVYVDKGEFVPAGGLLFEASGVQAIEINAQLPTKQFRPLVTGLSNNGALISLATPEEVQIALSRLHLEARVRLVGDSSDAAIWQGQLVRMSESVDPTRDTLGLVIVVNNPYENIIPGKRPPLLKGMFTSVELLAPAQPTLVVPRKAVHQGRVYTVIYKNDKPVLHIMPVHVLFQEGEMLVLDDKRDAELIGKQIIITDVIPVMEGLPLKTIEASDYKKKLLNSALGKVESEQGE